ncbi:putative methyltransferase-like protein 21E pseudogene [Phalaenopsis equestris]|uniref:putative methyltransferase-like protein 21E pseudogene n=1 Tax=Phalaenopsis equestris TaxID=78828 RepID=UPI0009E63CDC|nr:putative methyltransferase-like protein 21E pseudogene [Phalaenopsis equestris]
MAAEKDDEIDTILLSILYSDQDRHHVEQNTKPSHVAEASPAPPPHLDHRHHLTSINAAIVTRELPSQGLSFQLWPAATSFLSLLDRDPSPLLLPPRSPLRILELGSGTGLVGIAAAAILRAHVTLTDLPHVLPNLRFNAIANAEVVTARGGSLVVRQLRWGVAEDIVEMGSAPAFDAIIASDVVYYDHLIEPLLETIRVFVKEEVGFLMAHLRRWKKRDAVFFRNARKFLDVLRVHTDPPATGSRTGVNIYRFTSRRRSREAS